MVVACPFLGIAITAIVNPSARDFAKPTYSSASCFVAATSTMIASIVGFSASLVPSVAIVQAWFYDQPKESTSSHYRADPSLDRPGLAVGLQFPRC